MLQIIQHVSWHTRFNASEVVTSFTANVYISLLVMQV